MSSSVESRIVSMKFDNKDFKAGVDSTLASLGTLSKTLDAGFTSKAIGGLSRVGSAIKNFSFGSMGSAVEGVSGKFIALSTIAVTALSRITNSAITAATSFAKQFTGLQGLIDGYKEYELGIQSTQTILANTGESIKVVNKYLQELNTYSDQTVYNFGQMAQNIGRFTAAGVKLRPATDAIKGMANTAALGGATVEQLNSAMYQMSQAMSTGTIRLMDWNSLANANMGTKSLQESLQATAQAMGGDVASAMTSAIDKAGNFRDSLQEGWLSADIFTKTMKVMAGTLDKAGKPIAFTVEQLQKMGYSKEAAIRLNELSDAAIHSATDIKTFTQLVDVLKEAIGSGWARSFQLIVGNFAQAKELFTGINDVVGGFLQRQAKARNEMLQEWAKAGGRAAVLSGLGNLFRVFLKIVRPIRNAFRDIFPAATGQQLADLSKKFEEFTEKLLFGKKYSVAIKDVFKGIFSAFRLIGIVIGGVIKYVAEFFGILITGGGGDALGAILGLLAGVGRFVAGIEAWLVEGDRLKKFFDMIIEARNQVLEPIVGVIGAIVEALAALVSGDVSGFFDHIGDAGGHMTELFGVIGDKIEAFVANIGSLSDGIGQFFDELGAGGADAFTATIEYITDAVSNLREMFSGGASSAGGAAASVIDSGPFEKVAGVLKHFSFIADGAKAAWNLLLGVLQGTGNIANPLITTLGNILTSVGDFIARFFDELDFNQIMSLLQTGIFAKIVWMFGDVTEAMGSFADLKNRAGKVLDGMTNSLKTMQTSLRVAMIKDIAIAVGILALSMIGLAQVPKEKLASAGAALSGIMAEVGLMMVGLSKISAGGAAILAIGPTMIAIAIAVGILGASLLIFENVQWSSIIKAGVAIGALTLVLMLLAANAAGVFMAGKAMFSLSASLLVLSVGLIAFAAVKVGSIVKAVVAVGLLATIIGLLGTFAPQAVLASYALLVLAPALFGIAVALVVFNAVKWGSVFKAIVAIAALATTIGLLGTFAPMAIAGAGALLLLAFALNAIMIPLLVLGSMDIGTFAKSLGFMLATMLAVGVVGALLGTMSPLILAFGFALTTVGLGMLLLGAGVFALGLGLTMIAAAGTAAFAVLITGITSFLLMLPQWVLQFGVTIGAIINMIQTQGPAFAAAMGTVLVALLRQVRALTPELRKTVVVLIKNGLTAIRQLSGEFVKTGFKLIGDLMDGLVKNMPQLADKGAKAIIEFLKGIQRNDDKIAKEGVRTIVSLGKAMFGQIGATADKVYEWAKDIGNDLIAGIANAISGGWDRLTGALGDAVGGAIDWAKDKFGFGSPSVELGKLIVHGAQKGVDDNSRALTDAVDRAGSSAIEKMRNNMHLLGDAMAVDMNLDPTIRPVLDLTDVTTNAAKMARLLQDQTVFGGVSFVEASALSDDLSTQNSQNDSENAADSGGGDTFIQNNYSPKAISHADAYREGKSLFAMHRRKVGLDA